MGKEHQFAEDIWKPNSFGVRHIQSFLMFGGLVFGYFLRVNISAAIVPMTQPTSGTEYYDWDLSIRSLILSSFFWGYVLTQLPSSLLAKKFGPKLVLGCSTIIGALLTIIHPVAAKYGWEVIVVLRIFVGATQGFVYPTIHTLLAKWAPSPERSFLATSVYSGAQLGTVIILATSGFIFESTIGWPGIFYISGGIALLWAMAFLYFGANAPHLARQISKSEKEYIENLTGSDVDTQNAMIPWKAFFRSVPFYALIAAHCGYNWGFYTLLTEIPTYMSNVLQLNVESNALLSALPYLAMMLLCFVVSPISDYLIRRGILGVTAARKLFNTIGQWLPMTCLIALSYMKADDEILTITFLTLAVGFNSASFCGYLVNHMDLSPNFAGTMMGITNGLANLLSIVAPLVVGFIVTNQDDPAEWRIVFFITAGVYLVCNSIFLIFGQATVQSWNEAIYQHQRKPEVGSVWTVSSSISTQTAI